MKNVIGTPARGDSFFPRDREIRRVLEKLEDGNNLNIAAPRRVGKTSILLNLLDCSRGGYIYTYVDSEDVDSEAEFFKRVLQELLKTEEIRNCRKLKSLFESSHKFLSKVKSIKVMGQGVEFAEAETIADRKEDLINLLSGLELEEGKGLVILLDEFPQTIQNIIDKHPKDLAPVRKFLQSNREIRQNPEISRKVRFILTGSIGLNHTVAEIGMTAFINDLNSVEIGQLTEAEALHLFDELLRPKGIAIGEETRHYLLKKIEWMIPFHIQLMVQEILAAASPGSTINIQLVDRAFEAILQQRNENHFNHYYSRLKKQFKGVEFTFAEELLDTLAKTGMLGKAELFDLAVKHGLDQRWRNIINILIYDGYLSPFGLDGYRFNSPIVRMWWQRFICK